MDTSESESEGGGVVNEGISSSIAEELLTMFWLERPPPIVAWTVRAWTLDVPKKSSILQRRPRMIWRMRASRDLNDSLSTEIGFSVKCEDK